MSVQKVPVAWEQVLVRHVVEAKWNDVGRISSLLTAPFDRNSSTSCDGGGSADISLMAQPSGRWMFAARFAGLPWIALFSNAGTGEQLFEANTDSRRLEVAWIGCRPGDGGWFFRAHRGGKRTVDFAQDIDASAPATWECTAVSVDLLKGCDTGEQTFRRLCEHYGIAIPMQQIRADEGKFHVIGKRGKPVKTGLRGYHIERGPEIAAGENKAATALARAIDRSNAKGIRKAVQQGASLKALPDTSVSPLMSALYKCDRPGGKECVKALVELGCLVDGDAQDDPTVVNCVAHFVNEDLALEMLQTIVPLGADVNAATSRMGNTALHDAVPYRRLELVRFLLEHGADPTIKNQQGQSPIDWLRSRIEGESRFSRRTEFAEILSMLTGEPIEEPELPPLRDDLQAENERFRLCHKARMVLQLIPEEVKLRPIKASRLARTEPFKAWDEELGKTGFSSAGHFVETTVERRHLSAYTNPKLRMDAILSGGGLLSKGLRCEIAAYHPDDTVTVVANEQSPDDPDFAPQSIVRKESAGESPAGLLERLQELVAKKKLVAIEADSFAARYGEALRRIAAEIRGRAAHLLETPTILIDGTPPRYERLGCYLDLSSWDDPSRSTQRMAEQALAELAEAPHGDEADDPFDLEMPIRDALYLVAMRHLQFAGAPDSLDFIDQGCDVALEYAQLLAGKWRRRVAVSQIEELSYCLLLSGLTRRWDGVAQICEALKPKHASAPRDPGDPPASYAQVFLVLASRYRKRAIPKLSEMEEAIRKARPRRPRLLLELWQAIRSGDQANFASALQRSLECFAERSDDQGRTNDIIAPLAIAESVFNLAAMEQGLQQASLPQPLADLLITPESVGIRVRR